MLARVGQLVAAHLLLQAGTLAGVEQVEVEQRHAGLYRGPDVVGRAGTVEARRVERLLRHALLLQQESEGVERVVGHHGLIAQLQLWQQHGVGLAVVGRGQLTVELGQLHGGAAIGCAVCGLIDGEVRGLLG